MWLTADQVAAFHRESYVTAGPLLDAVALDRLRGALDALMERWATECESSREDYERVVSQWTNVWRRHPAFAEHLHNQRIAAAARQLLDAPELQLFHDHVISKPPKHSETVPWHQDFPFWPVSEPRALSCWVALDDVVADSGALRFMPGAHLAGAEPAVDFLCRNKTWGAREPEAVPVEVPAGWGVFHSCLSWHMSPPNTTNTQRRAAITILMDARCTYAPDTSSWHPMNAFVRVDAGDRFNADAFPLIRTAG